MKFSPHADECTTFENVRKLRFAEGTVEINIVREGEKTVFTNPKPFVIYYETRTSEILNTLQEVRFASEKFKVKDRLKELMAISDIQKTLKNWVEKQSKEAVS